MPSYSKSGEAVLATCHVDIQTIWYELIKEVNCTAICGHRTKGAQEVAVMEGKSQTHWPNSKHNTLPSMAIDSGPYFPELRNLDWEDIKAFCYFAGKVEALARGLLKEGKITHRIRWGGDWDGDGRTLDQKFNDLVHFELIPIN